MNWQPSASIETLRIRADILKSIREFFNSRQVLEVETPLMCHTSVTDPFIQSITAYFKAHSQKTEQRHYLQTSPEYAMKRLLAAGSGSIFQISKTFRQGDMGQRHNPEFTMLEWYRTGFTHHDLMNEMDELLQLVLKTRAAERQAYADVFQTHLEIDIHNVSLSELANCAGMHNINVKSDINDKDTWLQLLMSHYIEERIGQDRPFFIYDFPISQAALARIQATQPPVASRFEVYYKGIELANGFHELQNAAEQRKRFDNNLISRQTLGLETLPIDEHFLAALTYGLPDCAGVALGIDRLVMLATGKNKIADVLSFDFSRA